MYMTAFFDGAITVLVIEMLVILVIAFIGAWKAVNRKK